MVIDVSLSLSLYFDEDVDDDDVRFCGDLSFLNTFTLSLCSRRCNNLFFFFCRFSSFSSKSLKSGFARNLFRVDGVDEPPVVSSREEKF